MSFKAFGAGSSGLRAMRHARPRLSNRFEGPILTASHPRSVPGPNVTKNSRQRAVISVVKVTSWTLVAPSGPEDPNAICSLRFATLTVQHTARTAHIYIKSSRNLALRSARRLDSQGLRIDRHQLHNTCQESARPKPALFARD